MIQYNNQMANIFKPPIHTIKGNNLSIFLAGSIDMGKAVNWQYVLEESLKNFNVDIYNPRRDDFDASLIQNISNEPFKEQVVWELSHLEKADLIIYYFDPKGLAPITLLELGLYLKNKPVLVCCPNGFWRRGNIQIVCERYNIPLIENIDDLIDKTKDFIVKSQSLSK